MAMAMQSIRRCFQRLADGCSMVPAPLVKDLLEKVMPEACPVSLSRCYTGLTGLP